MQLNWLRRYFGLGSLYARLSIFAGLGATALLALVGVGLTTLYDSVLYRDVDGDLDVAIKDLIGQSEIDEDGSLVVSANLSERYNYTYSGWYWAIAPADEPQSLWARSHSLWDFELQYDRDAVGRAIADPPTIVSYDTVGPESKPLYVRVRWVRLREDTEPLLVFAATDRTALDQDVAQFRSRVFWSLGFAAVALLGLVLAMVQLGLRPLYRLRLGLRDIRAGRRQRLEEKAPTELAPLAEELNALMDHNEEIIRRARAQAGDLAHALKTPIAVLVAEAEADESPLADAVRRQAAVTREHVERHLKRSGAAARAQDARARTPIAPALIDLQRTVPKLYRDKEATIDWREGAPPDVAIAVRAAREDIVEMVGNLMDNAYKWASSRVEIEVVDDGERAVDVTVHDDGPGLSPDHREAAMKRGARMDETAPGSGLGLAIVKDLADAVGATFELEESPLGGLAARLGFPRGASEEG